jgi:hypothetical protein
MAAISALLTSPAADPKKNGELVHALVSNPTKQVALDLFTLARKLYDLQESAETGRLPTFLRQDIPITAPLDSTLMGMLREIKTKPKVERSLLAEEIEILASNSHINELKAIEERGKHLRGAEQLEAIRTSKWVAVKYERIKLVLMNLITGNLELGSGDSLPIYDSDTLLLHSTVQPPVPLRG